MYLSNSLQILQAHTKLSNISALMVIYNGIADSNEQQNSIDSNIYTKGLWAWLKDNTNPELFSNMRIKACLYNELYIFDIDIPLSVLDPKINNYWASTYINTSGEIVFPTKS